MKFYSTKHKSPKVSLKEAVIRGMPADKGLYMPETIPLLPQSFFKALPDMTLQEIGIKVCTPFLKDTLSAADIRRVVENSITFDTPLRQIHDTVYALELFHGPTLAFKDVGARFMARLLGKLHGSREKALHILVATSGDTGSAVAQGFYDVPGIQVIILYPSGKVSPVQEQQIATLDKNITTLEVAGTFDDCQRLVKSAFMDDELNRRLQLSSANSINIGRLLPQSFYYFHALGQLAKNTYKPTVFSVPSGNFGNLTAGLIARRMGLPVQRFIAAVNANAVFPEYLLSGKYKPAPSIPTISNAMDVGAPSNLGRIIDLFAGDVNALRQVVFSHSFSDVETRQTIKNVFAQHNYLLDPHGAVAFLGLMKYMQLYPDDTNSIILETAHPAKFGDVVSAEVLRDIELPARLKVFMKRKKTAVPISGNFDDFKQFLLERE